jgi:hypothetical protein
VNNVVSTLIRAPVNLCNSSAVKRVVDETMYIKNNDDNLVVICSFCMRRNDGK